MNFFVVLQQMLALFAMIFIGFYAYKVHWVTQDTSDRLSKLLVNILNPALLINGVLDKTVVAKKDLLLENLFYIFLYFVLLIGLSFPIAKVLRVGKMENRYQLMLIFSNVGFMGIPVLRSIFGNGCVIYITFYILIYNILIYTLGIAFAQRSLPKEERKNAVKEMINPGTVSAVFAILIFVFHPNIPQGAVTFFNYVGNAVIPFSMIIIGISIAQMPWKEIFGHVKLYIQTFGHPNSLCHSAAPTQEGYHALCYLYPYACHAVGQYYCHDRPGIWRKDRRRGHMQQGRFDDDTFFHHYHSNRGAFSLKDQKISVSSQMRCD